MPCATLFADAAWKKSRDAWLSPARHALPAHAELPEAPDRHRTCRHCCSPTPSLVMSAALSDAVPFRRRTFRSSSFARPLRALTVVEVNLIAGHPHAVTLMQ